MQKLGKINKHKAMTKANDFNFLMQKVIIGAVLKANKKEGKMLNEGFTIDPESQIKTLTKNIKRADDIIKMQERELESASERTDVSENRIISLNQALQYFKSCKRKYEKDLIALQKSRQENCINEAGSY